MNYKTITRSGRAVAGVALVAALSALAAAPVRADTVLANETNLVSGTQSMVQAFTVPTAGTVTVQLTNIAWPQALSALTFIASTSSQVLSSWDALNSGSETFSVSGPGTYYAHVTGTATGPLDLGLYSMTLSFVSAIAPVPLPAGSGLLLGGLLMLLAGAAAHSHRQRLLVPVLPIRA
jgi:hypothetical protein